MKFSKLLFAPWILALGWVGCGGHESRQENSALSQAVMDPNFAFISYFNAIPQFARAGEPVLLTWSAPGATYVEIVGVAGNLPNQGSFTVNPFQDTTYTLKVVGPMGREALRYLRVNITREASTILNFYAERVTLNKGESTQLRWNTTGCQRAQISSNGGDFGPTDVPCNGSYFVSPQRSSVYTLQVFDRMNNPSVRNSVTVQVQEVISPKVNYFWSNYNVLDFGGSANLNYATSNATEVSLAIPGQAPINLPTAGVYPVKPTETTTYVLTARAPDGKSTNSSLTIVVNQIPPRIERFAATQEVLNFGQSTNLSWSAVACVRAEITGAVQVPVPCSGQLNVQPGSSAAYTLNVYGSNGTVVSQSLSLRVNQPSPAPSIEFFYASAPAIERGQTTTLYWRVANCSRIEIAGIAPSPSNCGGSVDIRPPQNMNFQLTAFGQDGRSVSQSLSIVVNDPPAPVLEYFYASNSSIKVEKSTTLYWKVANAKKVELITNNQSQAVAATSSLEVSPRVNTSYRLRVTSLADETLEFLVSIEVIPFTEQELLDKLFKELQKPQ